ncbi:hypothetical protein [Edaphobacter acidisoli]|uniref:hypothetical protein n=1 Tax=Edaphobacter acidisoli TaxID=2040573 RepID=UPI001E2BC8B3|nr:hypothetical protein [Edaphobacter acidisoli]
MFEYFDIPEEKQPDEDPMTMTEGLGVAALYFALVVGSVLAFIFFGGRPYGMQYATLISYSGGVFIYIFFRPRGVNTRYRLSAQYVREQVPRLLMIHCVYLLAIFFLETWALAIRTSMPSWAVTGQGRDMPPFVFALMLVGMAIGISQIILSRRILGNAKKEFAASSARTIR